MTVVIDISVAYGTFIARKIKSKIKSLNKTFMNSRMQYIL